MKLSVRYCSKTLGVYAWVNMRLYMHVRQTYGVIGIQKSCQISAFTLDINVLVVSLPLILGCTSGCIHHGIVVFASRDLGNAVYRLGAGLRKMLDVFLLP